VNTFGGATRGDCFANKDESPVALVPPASGIGETVAEYPTVSWYMPKTEASEMEFVLKDAGNQVYSVNYSLDKYEEETPEPKKDKYEEETPEPKKKFFAVGTPGIMSLTLPVATSMSALKIGQEYHWDLTLICEGQSVIIKGMDGRIKRVEPNPTLAARLQQATPQERVTLYLEENLWYDAVATLVELGRDRPNDPKLAATWDQLLKSQGL